ncbi:MAG: hypothetical protein ACYC5O_13435 [Anaerolineae bacterium]
MPAIVTAGALYALLDASDARHAAMSAALDDIEPPLVVVPPVLADAMRLAERFLGRDVALRLMDAVLDGEMLLEGVDRRDVATARRLLQAEADIGPATAMALAAAARLGIATALCAEPGAAAAARRQGLQVLPAEDTVA